MSKVICLVADCLGVRGPDSGIGFDSNDINSRSMCRQSFAKDADINNIMARYAVSGVLVDPMNVDSGRVARFGDFSDLVDYPTLVTRIQEAQSDFMTLPSDVRARFENDVENLLDFISKPENVVEAVKLKVLPETMIDATFTVRPDLATPEWIANQEAKKKEAEAKLKPTPPAAAS